MACTKIAYVMEMTTPFQVSRVRCSALVATLPEDITHGGPASVDPRFVRMEVVTPADSRDPVFMTHVQDDDLASGGTARIIFDTIPGGDLTGAVVDVWFHFVEHATGGLTNVA